MQTSNEVNAEAVDMVYNILSRILCQMGVQEVVLTAADTDKLSELIKTGGVQLMIKDDGDNTIIRLVTDKSPAYKIMLPETTTGILH